MTTPRRGAATTSSTRGWCREFSSPTIAIDKEDPAIIDLAPTALTFFGIKPRHTWKGRPIIDGARFNER